MSAKRGSTVMTATGFFIEGSEPMTVVAPLSTTVIFMCVVHTTKCVIAIPAGKHWLVLILMV